MRVRVCILIIALVEPPCAFSAEAYLEAVSHILLKSTPRGAAEFEVFYGLRTTVPDENPCAEFPAEAFGGLLTDCGGYSSVGVTIMFADPVSWRRVWVYDPDSPIEYADPKEILEATTSGQEVPFVGDLLSYRDGKLLPWTVGQQVFYESDHLFLVPEVSSPVENPWRADVCVEILGTYTDNTGTVRGALLGSELGIEPPCAEIVRDELPWFVSTATASWGKIKALY